MTSCSTRPKEHPVMTVIHRSLFLNRQDKKDRNRMPIWQVKVLNRKHQRRKKKGVRDMYSPERLGSRPGRWGFCAGGHWSATRSSAALAPAPQQRPAPCLVAPAFLGPSLLFPSLFSLRGPFFFSLEASLSLRGLTTNVEVDGEGREAEHCC